MTNDLIDALLRLDRGELAEADAASLRRRLEREPDAREWQAWIAALRSGGAGPAPEVSDPERGGDEPDPIEIAALAEGTLPAERARTVRAALLRAPDGLGLLEAAVEEARHVQQEAAPRATPVRRPTQLRFPATWLAAAAVLLVVVLGIGLGLRGRKADLRALALREALAVPELRTSTDDLARGFTAYLAGDWSGAADAFAAAEREGASACESALYLGSSLLLAERDPESLAALLRARESCSGSFRSEALWQLAQAHLALGDARQATGMLYTLVAEGASHRHDDARSLLARLLER